MKYNVLHAKVDVELDMFEGESEEHALERLRKIIRLVNKLDDGFQTGHMSKPSVMRCETIGDAFKSCIR